MGAAGRKLAEARFDRVVQTERLERHYDVLSQREPLTATTR
jgi:hypothetical protein